ncbi:MAG TPA: BTAD domain-containing putative transcriptional regulator [Gemmatimonadales bacterium]|nr:BTAD domain-containing putative transcriptional regulator [Gemmatimonadales bacterium]
MGLLWPENDENTARHLLADSVYLLRRALGHDAILTTGAEIRLAPDQVAVDVAAFREAAGNGCWREALALYRGDFLDGFLVRNAGEFDRWAELERARLRQDASGAASALAAALDRQGLVADAVPWAERALELAPYDETEFRRLLDLLVRTGNRSRAEAGARGFVERLQADLGVPPSAETMGAMADARALPAGEPIVVVTPAANGRRTPDLDTRNLTLHGRYLWRRRNRSAVERAIAYFTRATERDPGSAEAWAGLSDAWCVLGCRGNMSTDAAADRAAPCAERALALDPSLSAAHTSAGGLGMVRRDWARAESALRTATALDPGNAMAHHWLANILLVGYGRRDEAFREQVIAARLDPLSPVLLGTLGWHRYLRGELALSRAEYERAVDLDTDFDEGHAGLIRAAARLDDAAGAEAALAAGLARRDDLRGELLAEGASALALLGERDRARERAEEAERLGALPITLAMAWAGIGDAERAFGWLEQESFQMYWSPHAVWWDPRLDGIRGDDRFADVVRRVKEAWRAEWA